MSPRIKLPWTRRAEQAEAHVEHADARLQAVRDQWPEAHKVAGAARREGELNGWTSNILSIFSGPGGGEPGHANRR